MVAGLVAGAYGMIVGSPGLRGVGIGRMPVGHTSAVDQVGGEGLGCRVSWGGAELFEVRGLVVGEAGEDPGDARLPRPLAALSSAADGDRALDEHRSFPAVDESFLGKEQHAGVWIAVATSGDVVGRIGSEPRHAEVSVQVDLRATRHGFEVEGQGVNTRADRSLSVSEKFWHAQVDGAAAITAGGTEEQVARVPEDLQAGGGQVLGNKARQEVEDVVGRVGCAVCVEAVAGKVEVFGYPLELAGAVEQGVPVGAGLVGCHA
ncbi:hypothetical protein C2142_10045 [Streptomyces sp. CB01881]|nr:hypothetical protein C2142_10045 [Streptomyces sp. CB01881]